jgi:Xaa-Pro aminopeptidase
MKGEGMPKITKHEFAERVEKLRKKMTEAGMDACFVYGDEYRRENLRYIANVWPLFERGAALIPRDGKPIILCAPEGEKMTAEMCAFPDDIRLVPEFTCVTVPDEIDYPFARYTTFKTVFNEIRAKQPLSSIGIGGIDAMPGPLYKILSTAAGDVRILDANEILSGMRLRKTENEACCLEKAVEIADTAYTQLMKAASPGVTELELAGVAVGTAMRLGAENVPFCLVSSGERVNTIIGRATERIIQDGDMVMAAIAVQYEGYIASFNFPFVVGRMSAEQRQLITWLIGAFECAKAHIKAGASQGALVHAAKEYFRKAGIGEYDLYPPLHGCGLAEAESPYPSEGTNAVFEKNMTVNTDISVFGHPYGSNRIEISLIVTEDGCISHSVLFDKLIKAWKEGKNYREVL